jgi:hypothetical protein
MAEWNRMSKRSKAAVFDWYGIPHSIKPREPRKLVDHPDLEKHVLAPVGDLLAVHPRVLWAIRMNSGAASYEHSSGRYAPIWFHKWVRSPEKYRMSDYLGATTDFRLLALECKKPSWTKPTDDREREQAAFLALVRRVGGIGAFITDAEQVNALPT